MGCTSGGVSVLRAYMGWSIAWSLRQWAFRVFPKQWNHPADIPVCDDWRIARDGQILAGWRISCALANGRAPARFDLWGGLSGSATRSGIANSDEMQVVGFVDDDKTLQGSVLNGKTIHSPLRIWPS